MVWCLRRVSWLAVLLGSMAAGCSVDRDFVNQGDFKCFDNNDCLAGYICEGASGDTPGVCQTEGGPIGPGCQDQDQDQYLAGEGCNIDPSLQDCNDSDRNINPGAVESCDGIDQNCNDVTDEDIDPEPCPLQFGVCANAMAQCVDGAFQDCAAQGLYGADFENVPNAQESCDGIDNNCSGGYPADATPEEIDAQCDCIPGSTPPSECSDFNGGVGECQRGVRFCRENGDFSECAVATQGSACTTDEECGENGFCIDEVVDPREDLFDDCELGSEAACQRSVCRTLTGSTACTGDGECDPTEICLEGFCQLRAQADEPEVCDGLDNDCNAKIDDGDVCSPCPFGMTFIEPFSGNPLGLCIDRWEASRPDATAGDAGSNDLYAVSRPDVLPWTNVDTASADEACRATAINDIVPLAVTPRFLCVGTQLAQACDEGQGTYPYGSDFAANSCNDSSDGSDLAATGSFPACCVQVGPSAEDTVCDLSGNAEEIVASPFAGGFGGNAGDSGAADLTCEVADLAGAPENLRGFRCCRQPLQ